MNRVKIPRTKADVERSYHQGHSGQPMLCVKVNCWAPDWLTPEVRAASEFAGDDEFWVWLDGLAHPDHGSWWDSGEGSKQIEAAWEFACDDGWEDAASEANGDTDEPLYPGRGCSLGRYRERGGLTIWGAGRSGGWLVVEGLPDVDDWDAIMLARWRRFARRVSGIVDDTDYRCVWNLHETAWQPIADEREIDRTDDAASLLPVLMGV